MLKLKNKKTTQEEEELIVKKLDEMLNYNAEQRWLFGSRLVRKQMMENLIAINKSKLAIEQDKKQRMNILHSIGMQKLKLGSKDGVDELAEAYQLLVEVNGYKHPHVFFELETLGK